jgi:hypothetical protein
MIGIKIQIFRHYQRLYQFLQKRHKTQKKENILHVGTVHCTIMENTSLKLNVYDTAKKFSVKCEFKLVSKLKFQKVKHWKKFQKN